MSISLTSAPPPGTPLPVVNYEPISIGAAAPPPSPPGPGLPPTHPLNPNRAANEAAQQQNIQQTKKKGLFGALVGTLTEVGTAVGKGINDTIGHWDPSSRTRFLTYFPDGQNENFYGEYSCVVTSGGQTIDVFFYITDARVGVVGKYAALNIQFPLGSITSILPVTAVVTVPNGVRTVAWQGIPPNGSGNALHIFTNDAKVHQFFYPSNFQYWYGTLDFVWRLRGGGGGFVQQPALKK